MTEPSRPASSGPRSTAIVGAGLFFLGLSAAAFLVIAARAVGPRQFSELAVLYTLVYTIGVGLFLPFEQEVSRAVAVRATRGEGPGAVVRRAAVLAFVLWTVTTLLGLLMAPVLLPWVGGSWLNLAVLSLACGGLGVQYVARGLFSGLGCFTPYAVQIGTEGVVRLLACVVMLMSGITDPAPYALLLAVAPLISIIATAVPVARLSRASGRPARFSEVSVNLGWLLGAAISAQGLANLGTVAVTSLATAAEGAAAGQFLAGFTIARIPLFLFVAVQAVLLPGLTGHLARGRHRAFRDQLRVVLLLSGALGVLGIIGAVTLGSPMLRLLFGNQFDMARIDLGLLAVSSAIYIEALVLQPAVIALAAHRGNAMAWISGLAVFGMALLVPLGILLRVEIALIAGAVTVCAVLWGFVVHGTTRLAELPPGP